MNEFEIHLVLPETEDEVEYILKQYGQYQYNDDGDDGGVDSYLVITIYVFQAL